MNNIKMKYIVVACLVVFIIKPAKSQNEPKSIIDDFFQLYETGDSDIALDTLFATNSWMVEKSSGDIENVKVQLSSLINLSGKYFGYEQITKKTAGSGLVLYSFLVKYERMPIRFAFMFYRPDKKWMIYNFKFDQNISQELEEATKVYRLMENFEY